jgi:hypothetical protein
MNNLSVDFTDNTGEARTVDSPSFTEIEHLVLQLDQDIKYYLEIVIDDNNKMIVGGGAGKYIVNICKENLLLQLINPDGNDESAISVYIGQESEYPTNWIVNLPEVISAAKFYYDNQEANPIQEWQ